MARKFQDLMPFSGFRRTSEDGCEEACIKLREEVKGADGRTGNAEGSLSGLFYCHPGKEVGDYMLPFRVSGHILIALNGENERRMLNRVQNIGTDGWDRNLPRTADLMRKGIAYARMIFTGTRHAELPTPASV